MKRILVALLLVLCFALSSCQFPQGTTKPDSSSVAELTAAELITNLTQALEKDTEGQNIKYAADWLYFYGLDGFSRDKLAAVEQVYDWYFIREVPDAVTVAKSMIDWVIRGLEEQVLDHTDYTKLTEFLISAYLVSVGDKYATYLNEQDYKSFQSDTSGNFVGVGVSATFNTRDNTIEVISVIAGSPAEGAGLQVGDFITHVDGDAVVDMGYYTAIDRIRGEEGTTVRLTILRGEESFEVDIVRAALTEQTVYHRIIGEGEQAVGYVLITTFSEVTVPQFKTAVDELEQAGVKAIVFDMRNNGGGLLTAVLDMLDYLLPDGKPLANYVYYDGSKEYDVGDDGHKVDLPFAIVTNAYTASAAELFSCALQDYAKEGLISHAKVVGNITYGKGTMQTLVPFNDDTALTVSLAYYQPPFSANYEGVGVIPDVEVSLPEIHAGKNPQVIPQAEDTQLNAALALLQ